MATVETIDKVIKNKGNWMVVFDYFEIAYKADDKRAVRPCNPSLSTGWGNLPAVLQGIIEVYKEKNAYIIHLYNNYKAHGSEYYMVKEGKIFYVLEDKDDYGYYYPNFEKIHSFYGYISTPYWEDGSVAENYLRNLLNILSNDY